MDSKRRTVDTINALGQPLKLDVISPNHRIAQEASMAYNLKVSHLIRQSAKGGERLLLRSEVEDYLLSAGIWTAEDSSRLQQLSLKIRAAELTLQRGGIQLSEGRRIAIEVMSKGRAEIMELVGKRQQLDSATVESVAENYKFAILVVKCVRYAEDGKPYFKSYDDFMDRGDEQAAIDACQILAEMIYNVDKNIHNNFFENRWLKKAGFVDNRGRFVNSTGHLIDEDGRLVDEDGRFVNENDELIDLHGIRITETGDFLCMDAEPFIGDNGQKVDVIVTEQSKTKKKRTSKKKTTKKEKSE